MTEQPEDKIKEHVRNVLIQGFAAIKAGKATPRRKRKEPDQNSRSEAA